MQFKRFLPKLLFAACLLLLFLIVKYQSYLKDAWSFNLEKVKIHFANFFYQTNSEPKRHRPVSLLQKETELKLYIGQPFIDFSKKDWNEFWNLIYGAFPREVADKQGLPKKIRQLTPDEISFELMSRYPQTFAYFRDSHWKTFFGIVLNK